MTENRLLPEVRHHAPQEEDMHPDIKKLQKSLKEGSQKIVLKEEYYPSLPEHPGGNRAAELTHTIAADLEAIVELPPSNIVLRLTNCVLQRKHPVSRRPSRILYYASTVAVVVYPSEFYQQTFRSFSLPLLHRLTVNWDDFGSYLGWSKLATELQEEWRLRREQETEQEWYRAQRARYMDHGSTMIRGEYLL